MGFIEKEGWFLIEKKVLFAADTISEDYINLWAQEWEAMLYDKSPQVLIDYPGEYDIKGVFIKAIADKKGKLNYILVEDKKSFAIVQSPRALDEDEISDASTIYYTDDAVEKKLDKLELEAKREKLQVNDT